MVSEKKILVAARKFHFDSSHYLPDYRGACERMHGHTYRLEVEVAGEAGEGGMVMDFAELKNIVKTKVLDELDHRVLNDIMENPTAENIIEWIWSSLKDDLNLHKIRLWEGHGKWVEKKA